MNTALKNDSVASTQPKRTGEYQTTNLFRVSDVKVDVESNLRGLHQLLNKSDFVHEPKEDITKVKSSNRNSMFVEESRKKRSVGKREFRRVFSFRVSVRGTSGLFHIYRTSERRVSHEE